MIVPHLSKFLLNQLDVLTSSGVHPLAQQGSAGSRKILIVDGECSFFKFIDLPSGARVNRAFVDLNFIHLSPFVDTNFCYAQYGQKLMLWFYPACELPHFLILPESYLAWKATGTMKDAVVYRQAENNRVKFFILKDGLFAGQFVKTLFHDGEKELEDVFARIRQEYDLSDPELLPLGDSFLLEGIKRLSLKDVLPFICINIDRKDLLKRILESLKWPIIFLLSTHVLVSYALYWNIEAETQKLQAELKSLRSSTQHVRDILEKHSTVRGFWEKFRASELTYVDHLDVMEETARVVLANQGKLIQLRFSEKHLLINLQSQDITTVIGELLKTGYFERLTVSGTITRDPKSGKESASLEGTIKSRKNEAYSQVVESMPAAQK